MFENRYFGKLAKSNIFATNKLGDFSSSSRPKQKISKSYLGMFTYANYAFQEIPMQRNA